MATAGIWGDAALPRTRRRRIARLALVYLALPAMLGCVVENRFVTCRLMGSGSMAPTLRADDDTTDTILIDRATARARPPRRGEIVSVTLPDGTWASKRVMGLPGEVVQIREGRVWVDGRAVVEPPAVAAVHYVCGGHLAERVLWRVAPDHFLVLGDDSSDSWDSRYFGCVARGRIDGLVRARVWPPSRLAWL